MSHRFYDAWLEDEVLKDWLVKVSNDESRAYCRYCAIVLRAHKTDLTTHSNCQKHLNNAKIAAESGTSTAPISVQIVCNDEDGQPEGNTSGDETGTPRSVPRRRPGTAKKPTSSYKKKYRSHWEQDPELEDWIAPFPKDETKAFCKRCGVLIRAHKHDLLLHGRSIRHQRNREELAKSPSEVEFDPEQDSILSTPVTIPHTPVIKGSTSDMEQDDTMEDGMTSFEMQPMDDSNEEEETSQPTPFREHKITPNSAKKPRPAQNHYPSHRRKRITAADVLAAIANNEFTGYEILQIVKKCVPKL